MHTHEAWTLLIIDDGMVRYDLHRNEHGTLGQLVTLLPPQVPRNGRAATAAGFGKRVVYLDLTQLRVHELHLALDQPGEEFAAENRLAFIAERLRGHLSRHGADDGPGAPRPDVSVAADLRDLIDVRFQGKMTLREASDALHAHPAHLARMFSREFGISPHQYVTGRRVDLARRLLLDGIPPSLAATEAGFYDQAHLTRHFRRVLATSPGRYARTAARSR